jgi:hypothetical protein
VVDLALAYIPPVMTVKLNVGGIEVSVADLDEAAALLRKLQGGTQQKPAIVANGHDAEDAGVPVDPESAQFALKLLRAIQNAPKGIKADGIMPLIGVSTPKAIGSKTAALNKIIKDLGFKKQMVYRNPRKPGEGRTWYPGRKIANVIAAIEAAAR